MHKFWMKAKSTVLRFRKTEKLYARVLSEYGWGAQVSMLAEESAELTVAVHHLLRAQTPETIRALASEIADVEIMIEQVRMIHPSLNQLSDLERKQKLRRLRERIEKRTKEPTP